MNIMPFKVRLLFWGRLVSCHASHIHKFITINHQFHLSTNLPTTHAYMHTNSRGETITMYENSMKELKEDQAYRYLGQDGLIGYVGPINEERVLREYLKWMMYI